ncbi:MAG: hypothetical protein AB1608_10185 [Thermoproteota archaeon]
MKSDKKFLILSRKIDVKITAMKRAILRRLYPSREIHQVTYEKNGKFAYEEYKKIQTEGNKRKIDYVFESEENIKMLSNYLMNNLDVIKFGLCHGTRRGKEQEWFRKHLNAEVIGTEISDTATMFPNTIQWDFHDVKDEWINNVDFIYSNSLDHSYDARYCLKQWFRCLRRNGICIINGTTWNTPWSTDKLDPFGYTKSGLKMLINELADECGIKIEEILDGNAKKGFSEWFYFIVRKVR